MDKFGNDVVSTLVSLKIISSSQLKAVLPTMIYHSKLLFYHILSHT